MSNHTNIPIRLTYDDILLVPKRSKIAHRHDVSTRTKLTGNITLEIPFISANMDTVTESRMAISLAHRGGIGIIHRFMSMEKQAAEVKKVKRHEGFILYKPFTLFPWSTVTEARLKAEETKVSSFIITDEKDRVKGILTRRDLIFAENNARPVSEIMTPEDKLIAAPQNITYKKAKEILKKHKIEKLPLVDRNNKLIGLITASIGRMAGDIGVYGNYIVAVIFFLVGLHLLGVIPMPWSGMSSQSQKKGWLAAFLLGLIFGIALGPCTFAYMAPVLGVTFKVAPANFLYAAALLLAYGIGHCSVIVVAGTSAEWVESYLHWTSSSKSTMIIKKICGILVILGGVYLIWTA